MAPKSTDTTKALPALIERIAAGVEFPDACYAVAREHHVDHQALTDAYDAHCADERKRDKLSPTQADANTP